MTHRTFIRSAQAWYARPGCGNDDLARNEEFALSAEGMDGEVFIRFHDLQNSQALRLEVFDDSLRLMPVFADVFAAMANKDLSPDQLHRLLLDLGLSDETKRTRAPAAPPPARPRR